MTGQTEEIIDDEEWLYRSFPVPDTRGGGVPQIHFGIIDGRLRVSRGAWNDTKFQPSVDRAKLITPEDTLFNRDKADVSDAVIRIQAKEVRAISGIPPISTDGHTRTHNVVYDKQEKRPAHSLIVTYPPFTKKPSSEEKKWQAFRELLALAASKHGWVIEPSA